MEANSATQVPTKTSEMQNDDRISKLPDVILHDILSLVPSMKIDVQTSILSKRWRYLWNSMPSLYLNKNDFTCEEKSTENFVNFVDMVLLHRYPLDIQKFRLCWQGDCDQHRAGTWISYAVRFNVQELVLDIGLHDLEKLPHCLFTSQSLQALCLHCNRCILSLPDSIDLRRLMSMHVTGIVSVGNSFRKLLLGCPLLENLHLEKCGIDNIDISGCPILGNLHVEDCYFEEINIFSHGLKNLTLVSSGDSQSKIQVSAPNLLYFSYSNPIPQDCSLLNLSSLVNASLDIKFGWTSRNVTEILKGIYNAKDISIFGSAIQHLAKEHLLDSLPTFHNLKNLEMGAWLKNDTIQVITHLLQCSPNLEYLLIENSKDPEQLEEPPEDNEPCWKSSEMPSDFLHHLKSVEIVRFKRSPSEHELVKFLLANVKYLEIMYVIPDENVDIQRSE